MPAHDRTDAKRACLVLGGGGFIGMNLCRRLAAAGHRVRAFGRGCRDPSQLGGAEWRQGDYADAGALRSALESFDTVYHLAHSMAPQSANLDIAADVRGNVLPSLALFDICRQAGVSRVVFVSSGGTVYGQAKQVPTPETAPTEPIGAYGVSKLAIEKYLAVYEHLHGLSYRVLRVSNAYGPFQTAPKGQGLIATIIARALSGEPVKIWGDGSIVRDYVFVEDVVDALEAATRDQGRERVFNIGSGQGHSVSEIVAAVEQLTGRKLDVIREPQRSLDVPKSVLAIDRARDALGWTPKTTLAAGLAKTMAWWRAQR